ncbi:MAG: hypothetical protein IJY91_05530 [Oscillospiraceae bacterium]|nr:hypothetical protein [Oscillospiraceae bacterium]
MVKGISKQVIVVNSPDKKLFDQAIFILSDDAMKENGISNEELMREAKALIKRPTIDHKGFSFWSVAFALSGALLTGIVWLLTSIL